MNITISNKDAAVKTRFEFAENSLLISTFFFTNTPPPKKSSIPSFCRKWKDKWFVKTVTWVPASFLSSLLLRFVQIPLNENKEEISELIAWLSKNISTETKQKEA